jgi:predicted nuclease with RNAse H fold
MTVGVDLSVQPKKTGIAWIDWSPSGAQVRNLVVGARDELITQAVIEADKAGIDCPLGWPETFVKFISAHHTGNVIVPAEVADPTWQSTLAYRVTDKAVHCTTLHDTTGVHDTTGLMPLSVAADRIAYTAMRCARLLAQLASKGQPVDRCGTGVVVEVYPAASLKQWGLPHRGYKGKSNIKRLAQVVDALLAAAPWLTLDPFEDLCRCSDDALDAVIAALTARAATKGLVTAPNTTQAATSSTEGWIALPTCPLSALSP